MNRSITFALAGIALLVIGIFTYRALSKGEGSGTATSSTIAKAVDTTPGPKRATSESEAPTNFSMPAMVDDDPEGTLRLEGQVVNELGHGIPEATVILGSAPPRTVQSEGDGSFVFDKLVSRRYSVHARSADRVGGPVIVMLSETSDPVLVRMQVGGGLEIEVVDKSDAPIGNASVSVPEMQGLSVPTNAQGVATLDNLPAGQIVIAASAPGFASATTLATVPRDSSAKGRQRLTLLAGVSVSGRVLKPDGTPLEAARVIARPVGTLLHLQDPKRDGVATDKEGRFVLPAVPSGGTQLFAIHDDYAPTIGERFSIAATPITDLELTMREGASIAGQVQGNDGTPSPWATVRVIDAAGGGPSGDGLSRQMISDEAGKFEMKGLPRNEVIVHASSDSASSESLSVNLQKKARVDKLVLSLDVEGEIRGVVVDEKGQPIAEAQVRATPDFWEGADMQELRVRGPAFATTAGDGSFVLRGLPPTKVLIVASRSLDNAMNRQRGVPATTGDSNVRLVLASPGRIIGKVQASDGSTPAIAMVSIGWETGVPTSGGRFAIDEVPPGTFELSVQGPTFAATQRSNVTVEAGEILDLGIITVKKGRSVSGRVLYKGAAVADAEVALARQLVSDGSSLTPRSLGDVMDQGTGLRRATSDAQGGFTIVGIGKGEWTIAADQAEKGRSLGALVPAGEQDVILDLELRDVGSVRGNVTLNGAAQANVQVLITSTQTESQHLLIVTTDPDGAFFAERVASGEHKVSAVLQSAGAGSMSATTTKIEPGQESVANLDIVEGAVTLDVSVVAKEGAVIDAAQVFLFKGVAQVQTGVELNKLFLSASADAKMSFAMADGKTRFEKLAPGSYSLCVIPIRGDMNDPSFGQKLQRHVNTLAVYCQPIELSEAPANQSVRSEVPEMTPLPED